MYKLNFRRIFEYKTGIGDVLRFKISDTLKMWTNPTDIVKTGLKLT